MFNYLVVICVRGMLFFSLTHALPNKFTLTEVFMLSLCSKYICLFYFQTISQYQFKIRMKQYKRNNYKINKTIWTFQKKYLIKILVWRDTQISSQTLIFRLGFFFKFCKTEIFKMFFLRFSFYITLRYYMTHSNVNHYYVFILI